MTVMDLSEDDLALLADVRRATTSGQARKVREEARLSQTELARTCGVSPATVSRWESGKRRPRGAAALRYGRVLRVLETQVEATA